MYLNLNLNYSFFGFPEALNLRPSASEQKNRLADAVKQALEFTAR